jgi:hypothetical protein
MALGVVYTGVFHNRRQSGKRLLPDAPVGESDNNILRKGVVLQLFEQFSHVMSLNSTFNNRNSILTLIYQFRLDTVTNRMNL